MAFRISVSKSRVGYSIGGKGFRTGVNARGRRSTSISVRGTGLRYSKSGGKGATGCLVVLVAVVGGAIAWMVA